MFNKIVTIHKLITEDGFRYPLENVIDLSIENTGATVAIIFDDKVVPVGGTVEDNYPNGLDPRQTKRTGDVLIKFVGGTGQVSLLLHVWGS